MLPNYAPLIIAEQFGTLNRSFRPIDLPGLGPFAPVATTEPPRSAAELQRRTTFSKTCPGEKKKKKKTGSPRDPGEGPVVLDLAPVRVSQARGWRRPGLLLICSPLSAPDYLHEAPNFTARISSHRKCCTGRMMVAANVIAAGYRRGAETNLHLHNNSS